MHAWIIRSRDLHADAGVEDAVDGPDLEGGADGEEAHEALRRHPHPADVDALQPPALVHQRHQPGLRHVAAAPQDDALCAHACMETKKQERRQVNDSTQIWNL